MQPKFGGREIDPPGHSSISLISWMESNLRDHLLHHTWNIPRNTIFACGIWQLWKARNNLQFDILEVLPSVIASKTLCFAKDSTIAFTKNHNGNTINRNMLINWKFLITGRVKINTDGSSVDYGWASFGGVLERDGGGDHPRYAWSKWSGRYGD